jgi:type I restriction enzyme S subunit
MIPAAPKLRFPEFKDPWKPGHAGDAFDNSRAKGEAGLPIYSVTMDRGLVRRDSLDRHMAADAADGQNLRAQEGDVAYNMMRMWQGAVGLAPEECMVSPAYVVLSPKKQTSSEFFDQWFKAKRMLYLLGAYSHGITSDRLRLYADDFARIPLHLPTLPEQQKIAAFMGAVDAKIATLAAKHAALERFKAGLMHKLFRQQTRFTSDNGQTFPDWGIRSLGSIGTVFGGLSGKTAEDFGAGRPFVTYRQVFEDAVVDLSRCKLVRIGANERQHRVERGDVLFTTSSETPGEVGFATVVLEEPGELYLNSFCFGFRPDQTALLSDFARYLFRNPEYRKAVIKLAQGSTRYNISKSGFLKLRLAFPHPHEQRKIADALMDLDVKIQAEMDQLTQLVIFKKGLLQQMFT